MKYQEIEANWHSTTQKDASLRVEDVGSGWHEHAKCRGRGRKDKQKKTGHKISKSELAGAFI